MISKLKLQAIWRNIIFKDSRQLNDLTDEEIIELLKWTINYLSKKSSLSFEYKGLCMLWYERLDIDSFSYNSFAVRFYNGMFTDLGRYTPYIAPHGRVPERIEWCEYQLRKLQNNG